jgi:spore maturation protein CgeB
MTLLDQQVPISRPKTSLRIVILGLSITSSWGNGHATTYRGLVRELTRRGHSVLFLERDQPWYARQSRHAAAAFRRDRDLSERE